MVTQCTLVTIVIVCSLVSMVTQCYGYHGNTVHSGCQGDTVCTLVAMVTYCRNDPLCLVLSLLEWREGGAGGLVTL